MPVILKNNVDSVLAQAVNASETAMVVATGEGTKFPALAVGEYFYATLVSAQGTREIVKVTGKSGDTLAIQRGQEGTTANGFSTGSRVEMRVTAASITDLVDEHDQASEISIADAGGYYTSDNVEGALQEAAQAATTQIADAGGYYTSDNVEGALQEAAQAATTQIADAGGYYTSDNVEGALQEAAQASTTKYVPPGMGAVTRTVQSRLRDFVSVKDFGAVGDGVTDDTAAIQACADYLATQADSVVTNGLAAKNKQILYFPPSDGYVITDTVTVDKNISVIMDGPVLVSAGASAAKTWFRIAPTTAGNTQGRNLEFVIDVRRLTQSDWSSQLDVGCEIIAAAACDVWLRRADNFAVGVKATLPYSNVRLGEFRDCQVGLDLVGTAYDFTNQMVLIGGEFACISGVGVGLPRYGVRITQPGTGPAKGNSFTFIGPSFELNAAAAGAAETRGFVLNDTWNFIAQSVRTEGSGPVIAKLTGDCRNTTFELIIGNEFDTPTSALLDDQSTYKIFNEAYFKGVIHQHLVFDSGLLSNRLTYANSSNLYAIDGMDVIVNYGGAGTAAGRLSTVGLAGTRPNDDGSVSTGSIMGVAVKTDRVKNFIVEVDKASDPILNIIVYDANGDQLTGSSDVLQNGPTPTVTPNTAVYGGLYSFSTQFDGSRRYRKFTFSDNVKEAFIGVSGTNLFAIKIWSVGATTTAYTLNDKLKFSARSERTPLQGDYQTGQIVWYRNTAAGGAPGYYVTQGGHLNRTFGGTPTADTTAGSAVITLTDAAEVRPGMYIDIAGESGSFRVLARQGSWARISANCANTASGSAVSFTTPVVKTLATIAP